MSGWITPRSIRFFFRARDLRGRLASTAISGARIPDKKTGSPAPGRSLAAGEQEELEPLPPVSLDEAKAKAKVCEGIDAFPLFWVEDLPTLKAHVRAAPSFAAMHDRLGLDWFSAY